MGIKENIFEALYYLDFDVRESGIMNKEIQSIIYNTSKKHGSEDKVNYVYTVISELDYLSTQGDRNRRYYYRELLNYLNKYKLIHVEKEEPDYMKLMVKELRELVESYTFDVYDSEIKNLILQSISRYSEDNVSAIIKGVLRLYSKNPMGYAVHNSPEKIKKGTILLMIRGVDILPILNKYAVVTNSNISMIRLECLKATISAKIDPKFSHTVNDIVYAIKGRNHNYIQSCMKILDLKYPEKKYRDIINNINTIVQKAIREVLERN